MTGYIYCKAYGGLNDALTQLNTCTQYAINHKRSIILEFMDYNTNLNDIFDFSKYPVPITTDLSILEGKTFEPEAITPYIHEKEYIKAHIMQFNKGKKYSADVVLVHASAGGGNGSIDALAHLSFTTDFITSFKTLYKDIPPIYACIHIRNTDMATTVEKHRLSIKSFIRSDPLYICSDSKDTVDWAVKEFKARRTSTQFYGGEPLHGFTSYINGHVVTGRNIANRVLYDALYDLLILARATRILIIKPDRFIASGFGALAKALHSRVQLKERLLKP